MGSVLAIDIGGTSIKSARVEVPASLETAVLTDVRRTSTPVGSAPALVAAVHDIVRSYDAVDAVGVVMPGLLDVAHGRIRAAGNMQLFDEPIVGPLQDAIGLPVSFEHDVRAGAMAELHAGAARGLHDAIFMPIGTGIAAAFIIDGDVRSAHGFMGEAGHIYVGPDEPCVCGNLGCLETIASAAAIARRYEARTGRRANSAEVIALSASDADAKYVWDTAIAALVRACATMCNLLGPEVIIIGGGLARAGDVLLDPIREGLARSLTFQRVPEVIPPVHGDDAGCLGAAIYALRDMGVR